MILKIVSTDYAQKNISIMYTINLQNLQTPQFLTDNNGKSIALIPAEEYKALLAIAEMYEDLEDIQAFKEAEGEETEPLDVFLKRVEKTEEKMESTEKKIHSNCC